jgi:hypothetical protein
MMHLRPIPGILMQKLVLVVCCRELFCCWDWLFNLKDSAFTGVENVVAKTRVRPITKEFFLFNIILKELFKFTDNINIIFVKLC